MTSAEMAAYGAEGTWALLREHEIRWSECDLLRSCQPHRLSDAVRGPEGRLLAGDQRHRPLVGATGAGDGAARGSLRQAGRFHDRVLLTARTVSLRRTSFTHEYALWKNGLACSARAVCVVVVNDTGVRVPIPAEVRRVMIERDGARDEAQPSA
jgi:acyl-CoA thioester hydrolase